MEPQPVVDQCPRCGGDRVGYVDSLNGEAVRCTSCFVADRLDGQEVEQVTGPVVCGINDAGEVIWRRCEQPVVGDMAVLRSEMLAGNARPVAPCGWDVDQVGTGDLESFALMHRVVDGTELTLWPWVEWIPGGVDEQPTVVFARHCGTARREWMGDAATAITTTDAGTIIGLIDGLDAG